MKNVIPRAYYIFSPRFFSMFLAVIGGVVLFDCPEGLTAPSRSSIAEHLQEWKILTAPKNTDLPAHRYADFLQHTSDWPLQSRILWRYQHALLQDDSASERPTLCPSLPITQWATLIACAPYLKDQAQRARSLWTSNVGNDDDQTLFLQHYQSILTPQDQWQRYVYLEKAGQKTRARQQIDRLTPLKQPQARARFALRFNQSNADEAFSQAPQPYEQDIVLLRLKYLRRQTRYDDALRFWQQVGITIEQRIPSPSNRPWITERLALARSLLRQPDATLPAQTLLLLPAQSRVVPSLAEQEEHLLSAYIHLVLLNEPTAASTLLSPLLNAPSLSARAAGIYWSARCEEALNHHDRAQNLYEHASAYPTTFYGQMALAHLTQTPFLSQAQRSSLFLNALKQRLNALPAITTGTIVRPDLAEAAQLLHDQNDDEAATLFLNVIQGQTHTIADQKAIADLALSFHISQPAISAARTLARQGVALFPEGYPYPSQLTTLTSPTLPPGLVPALIRQESSGNPTALSPRNAVGLMQLLPSTARLTAHHHNVPLPTLNTQSLTNPSINITLGQLYLQELSERFNAVVPHILAAYNAGPGRVRRWNTDTLSALSNPNHTLTDDDYLLHWLITLPYQETRLYVEHIETDMSLYAVQSLQ